jgi:hypothetical protein
MCGRYGVSMRRGELTECLPGVELPGDGIEPRYRASAAAYRSRMPPRARTPRRTDSSTSMISGSIAVLRLEDGRGYKRTRSTIRQHSIMSLIAAAE